MNTPVVVRSKRRIHPLLVVLLALFLLGLLAAAGVASYFRLGSETAALRRTTMASIPGRWHSRITLNVGYFTMGLVRCGSHLFNLPPEPRAVLNSLSRAEVGVYELRDEPPKADVRAIFRSADRAMNRRGWERIVGVAEQREVVAIYIPAKPVSPEHMKVCLMVWDGHDLVVASARGNVAPLLELARSSDGVPNRLAKLAANQ
jgi:hypothetical protein